MRIRTVLSLAAVSLLASSLAGAALVVEPTSDAVSLVATIAGPGVGIPDLGAAAYVGHPGAAGVFTGGTSAGLGIDTGIVLTTGLAESAPGPNDHPATSSGHLLPGDPDLETLFSALTGDASVLTFTFQSSGETLLIRYVFASEQYPLPPDPEFGDALGIFLDSENISFVPATTVPVSANSVGPGQPSLFRDNQDGSIRVEYDGLTTVFTAPVTGLEPGLHSLKLAIADTGDFSVDSAVFIQIVTVGAPVPESSVPVGAGEPIPIDYGEHAVAEINTVTDLDSFHFQGSAGELAWLVGRTTSAGLDLQLELLGPAGGDLGSATCSGGTFGLCTVARSDILAADGTYTVLVSDASTDEAGGYLLQLERFPPTAPAAGVTYNSSQQDEIAPSTDIDFLEFNATAGTIIRMSVASRAAGLDPQLQLFTAAGVPIDLPSCGELSCFCSGGTFGLCSFTVDRMLETSGRHLVALSDAGSDEQGAYEFGLQCLFGDCTDVEAVPEPAAILLQLVALTGIGLGAWGRRRW